jgi:hypothetical protein
MSEQIVYEKVNCDNYHVTLKSTGMTISVNRAKAIRILGLKSDVVLGCCPVSLQLLHEIGFIVLLKADKMIG